MLAPPSPDEEEDARMTRLTRRRFLGGAAAGVSALSLPARALAAPSEFVWRLGPNLMRGLRRWRLHGASSYGTTNPGGTESIADLVTLAVGARLNTVRIVNFLDEGSPSNPSDPSVAPFDPAAWRRVDALLAALRAAGMNAILDLSTYRNLLQNRLIATGSTTTPYSVDWGPFVRFVSTRRNTVTNRLYVLDPTIAIVAFAGEPNPPNSGEPLKPTTDELTSFYRRTLSQWKRTDPLHLLSNGGFIHLDWEERFGNPNGSGIDWRAIFALPANDVPSIHTYPALPSVADDFQSPKVAAYCASIRKPWLTEEFGLEQSVGDTVRANWFADVYGIQSTRRSSGAAFWNLGPELPSSGASFDVNPGTPLTWNVVRSNTPG
jgi:hypothetical protein